MSYANERLVPNEDPWLVLMQMLSQQRVHPTRVLLGRPVVACLIAAFFAPKPSPAPPARPLSNWALAQIAFADRTD